MGLQDSDKAHDERKRIKVCRDEAGKSEPNIMYVPFSCTLFSFTPSPSPSMYTYIHTCIRVILFYTWGKAASSPFWFRLWLLAGRNSETQQKCVPAAFVYSICRNTVYPGSVPPTGNSFLCIYIFGFIIA